jgi:hypothetical protein
VAAARLRPGLGVQAVAWRTVKIVPGLEGQQGPVLAWALVQARARAPAAAIRQAPADRVASFSPGKLPHGPAARKSGRAFAFSSVTWAKTSYPRKDPHHPGKVAPVFDSRHNGKPADRDGGICSSKDPPAFNSRVTGEGCRLAAPHRLNRRRRLLSRHDPPSGSRRVG